MQTKLSREQIKRYKTQAHQLKPVILIGDKGLTKNVLAEIEIALEAHELIKIKINGADRDERKLVREQILEDCQANLIQAIGRTFVIYRKRQQN